MAFPSQEQLMIQQAQIVVNLADEAGFKRAGIERLRAILAAENTETEKFNEVIQWMNETDQGANVD